MFTNKLEKIMAEVKAIRFHAAWCGPCRAYKPLWENVEKELVDETSLEFISVDIDKDTEGLAAKYKVQSIPTTVIVKDGEMVAKEVGLIQEQKLKELILF